MALGAELSLLVPILLLRGGCRESCLTDSVLFGSLIPTANNHTPMPYFGPVAPRSVLSRLFISLLLLLLSDLLKDLWWTSLSCWCSVARSCLTLPPHRLPHARLSCPSLSSGVCSSPLSPGCYLTISSSAALFSFSPQSLPASRSFPMSWLLASGDLSPFNEYSGLVSFRIGFLFVTY